MADVRDLIERTTVDGTEQVYVEHADTDRRMTTTTLLAGLVSSEDFTTIVALTEADYDLLDPPDPTTLYIFTEET